MKNIMEYKGYLGSVEFSEEDELFFGRVLGIRSLISYEADNAKELISDFHNSVDEYLNMCEEEGKEPDKAYKGSFNIRISPQLHKQLVICAMDHNTTLNGYIQEVLEKAVMQNLKSEVICNKRGTTKTAMCHNHTQQKQLVKKVEYLTFLTGYNREVFYDYTIKSCIEEEQG